MNNVKYRFNRANYELVIRESNTVESAILDYRKQVKRRAKKDRAIVGSFEYSINNGADWLKPSINKVYSV